MTKNKMMSHLGVGKNISSSKKQLQRKTSNMGDIKKKRELASNSSSG
jgi:hypothetical protein